MDTRTLGLDNGAGPLIGLWDYQDGVPGRGGAKAIPSMCSIELQATRTVPEWNGQAVRMAQEEDVIIHSSGKVGAPPAGQAVPGSVGPMDYSSGAY